MGESPGAIEPGIETEERLRRVYYEATPPPYDQGVPLGQAVAASGGVPGVFQPVQLDGLYPGRSVRLVDGGVRENQGLAGLLEHGRDVFLVSDGSDQIEEQARPASNLASALLRSAYITQKGVRAETYQVARERLLEHQRKRIVYVHMKSGLSRRDVKWSSKAAAPSSKPPTDRVTRFGVSERLQRALSRVRTNLDLFTADEMLTVMANGYRLAQVSLQERGLSTRSTPARPWVFSPRLEDLEQPPRTLLTEVEAAANPIRTLRRWQKRRS